ncbi:nuclear transport factor 2 family protein [Cobetia sp. SIMBA_158]|uniref:nuclear transport factor 2 family protein n=1 Tax=Cobetia sp. SIMBA_158 TaxID=3081617 RepID=UPI00397F447A
MTHQATIELLTAFCDALNRHDIDDCLSMMTDDCEFLAIAGLELEGKTFAGQDAVRAGLSAAWQNAPDAQWIDAEIFADGERGFVISTYTGATADGARSEARMIDAFTLRDGKIAIKNAFRKNRPPVNV